MTRAALVGMLAALSANAATRYPVTALILNVDKPHHTFTASMSEIPGYMKAMVMPFPVRDPKLLAGLMPSMVVDFTLVVDKDRSWVEGVRERAYQSLEQEPMLARRLQLLANLDKKNPWRRNWALGR